MLKKGIAEQAENDGKRRSQAPAATCVPRNLENAARGRGCAISGEQRGASSTARGQSNYQSNQQDQGTCAASMARRIDKKIPGRVRCPAEYQITQYPHKRSADQESNGVDGGIVCEVIATGTCIDFRVTISSLVILPQLMPQPPTVLLRSSMNSLGRIRTGPRGERPWRRAFPVQYWRRGVMYRFSQGGLLHAAPHYP